MRVLLTLQYLQLLLVINFRDSLYQETAELGEGEERGRGKREKGSGRGEREGERKREGRQKTGRKRKKYEEEMDKVGGKGREQG